MKSHNSFNIGGLLQFVSPVLIANYEKINLGCRSLELINKRYKSVSDDPDKLYIKWLKMNIIMMFSGAILGIIISRSFFNGNFWVLVLTMAIVTGPVLFWLLFPINRKVMKASETLRECVPILVGFRDSVEALNPLGLNTNGYSPKSVHDTLAIWAEITLNAEISFDSACSEKGRKVASVLCAGKWLEKCNDRFEKILETAKVKFGLTWSKREIFEEAKALKTRRITTSMLVATEQSSKDKVS